MTQVLETLYWLLARRRILRKMAVGLLVAVAAFASRGLRSRPLVLAIGVICILLL